MRYNSTYKRLKNKFDIKKHNRIIDLHESLSKNPLTNFIIEQAISTMKLLDKKSAYLFCCYKTIPLSFANMLLLRKIREETKTDYSFHNDRFYLFNSISDRQEKVNLDLLEIPTHSFHLNPEIDMTYPPPRDESNSYFQKYPIPIDSVINRFQISKTPITTKIWNGLALVDTFKDIEWNKEQEDPLKEWYSIYSNNLDMFRTSEYDKAKLVNLLGQYNPNNVPMTNISFYEALLFCNKLSEYFGLEPYYNIKEQKRVQNLLLGHEREDISEKLDWSKMDDNIRFVNYFERQDGNDYKIVEDYFAKLWVVDYSEYDNISGEDDWDEIPTKIKTKMRQNAERWGYDDDYDYSDFEGFEDLKSFFNYPDIYDKRKNKIVYNKDFYTHQQDDHSAIFLKNILDIELDDKKPINEKANGFRLPFSWELLSIISLELNGFEGDAFNKNELQKENGILNLNMYERLTPNERYIFKENSSRNKMLDEVPHIFCSSTKKPYLDGVFDIVGNVYKWVNDSFLIDQKYIEDANKYKENIESYLLGDTIAFALGCSYNDDAESLKRQGRDDKGNINITHDNLFRRLAIKQGYEDVGFFVCRNTTKD